MNTFLPKVVSPSRKRQGGSAAIELALLLPIMMIFLTIPSFYARCFWHYSAAQKAAQNAALYLSTVPAAEMRSKKLAKAAGNTAIEIARRQIAELAPGSTIDAPDAYCDDVDCGTRAAGTLPTTVQIHFTINMYDSFFNAVETGRYGVLITAKSRMRYVGN